MAGCSQMFLRNVIRSFVLVQLLTLPAICATPVPSQADNSLHLPRPGENYLHCLSPTVLELTLVSTRQPDQSGPWDFVDATGSLHLPSPGEFEVHVAGNTQNVSAVGFKRRVIYAPLKQRDLRVGNHLYLILANPLADFQQVEVKNPNGKLWPTGTRFVATFDPTRWSPAIHVNQTGYLPGAPKKAMIGYFLGSLGEMHCSVVHEHPPDFKLIETQTGREVYQGRLASRPDHGYADYQQVLEADFSGFNTPGEYRLMIPGLGASYPFLIDEGIAGAFARTYALGLYHQRCGTNNVLPFTRFTHAPCHTAPADIPLPQSSFAFTWNTIAGYSANNPSQSAPQLKDEASQLYPFAKRGRVDVSGGHHDAGDYSKYTINSAALIHHLILAVDAFPGVAALDNLGLPESGDGKSDLLQEAKWEADFLAKMQDADGGFYFLVYPREREYENDVPPDRGDEQVVWPKTTSVAAAAVAALAQCASSPEFKKEFPQVADAYLKQARAGWDFLQRAVAAHGKDGAYQKITHYGNEFGHNDELAWAACELFLATGEPAFHEKFRAWLNPSIETRRWGWWRLYESYGCAIRSYALAAPSGKIRREQLDPKLLAWCENEVIAAANDQLHRALDSAYGTSMPEETKRTHTAGWYFSGDAAFDLAVACQLDYPSLNDPRPKFRDALLSNINYEAGCNPVNMCYLAGLGWQRPREVVNQYAQNSRRTLPPDGIPIGNVQAGFGWIEPYGRELGALSYPPDGDTANAYPFYDRWGDSFNLSTEFVTVNQARSLACLAWLMAQTPLKNQPWRFASARIVSLPEPTATETVTLKLDAPGLDLSRARIVWEADGQEPFLGPLFHLPHKHSSSQWIEAEAQLPDGRRAFAAANLDAIAGSK